MVDCSAEELVGLQREARTHKRLLKIITTPPMNLQKAEIPQLRTEDLGS